MRVNKNVAVSGSGFLFNASTGDSFSVNKVGLDIINQLKEGQSLDSVIEYLFNEYEIDRFTVEKDVYDFSKMLKEYNLMSH